MYEVWFISEKDGEAYLFISDVPNASFANRIATNLVEEGFAFDAWYDKA